MTKIRVLIVDDSALMRQLLREILAGDPHLEVVGAASDPIRAWEMIQRLRPDVLTLDVEMPRMDGLEFLQKLMRAHPMPVVMCSSLTEAGCETTLRALELGAVDFVSKPKVDVTRSLEKSAQELRSKVKAAGHARVRVRSSLVPKAAAAAPSLDFSSSRSTAPLRKVTDVVLAVGASTGGTEAIREVLEALPADAPGVVIVQHMPELFTRHFADRLDRLCAVRVHEAEDGDRILPGHVLIAPGGGRHMEVVRSGAHAMVKLVAAPPVNHHRPSVDTLFHSCARVLGPTVVGAILTGMGADGAEGLLAMRRAGAHTIAQDEATCIVYGMPKEAVACNAAEVVAPLGSVAGALLRFAGALSGSASRRSSHPAAANGGVGSPKGAVRGSG